MSPLPPFPPGAPIDPLDPVRLDRYFAGEATPAEVEAIERWIAGSPDRLAELDAIRGATRAGAPGVEGSLDVEAALAVTMSRATPGRATGRRVVHRRPWARWATAVAASVVAALVAWHWAVEPHAGQWRVATVPFGHRATLTLADGTRITVNAGTTIRYPQSLGPGSREVYLDGEALFTVVHDARHPFIVHAGNAVVTDIGTQFDVRAYATDRAVYVAVAEGRVGVDVGRAGPGRSSTVLRPAPTTTATAGDVATVIGADLGVAHHADLEPFVAWTRGQMVFEDTPLRDVAIELSRTFDLDVVVADSALNSRRVTATFGDEPADDVLDAVTRAVSARYDRIGRRVVIKVRDVQAGRWTPAPTAGSDAEQRIARAGAER